MTLEEIWGKSLLKIEEKIGTNIFELWIKPIRPVQLKEQQFTLEVPNRFFKEWIEDYYPTLINETLEGILGRAVTLKYRIAEKQVAEIKRIEAKLESRKTRLANRGIYLNPKYTFENFITGQSNQFAQAAAKAVAEAPGRVYNPLFIYGGVGLGKTHLISAIGNSVIDSKQDCNMLYVPSEQFTNEVVSAVRHGKTEELKKKYRNVDLLLIDDIQFVENKMATQEELFYTINTLYEKQKQIVISSDRPPKEIKTITDRLRSRFSMGLIADIQPPEYETRVAIIHKKAAMERLNLKDDVINFIAAKVKTNVRELEGCLIRLGAQAALTGSPIDVEMAKAVLKDFIQDEKPVTTEQILKTVCEYFGLKMQDIKARKRTKEIALPRQIAMYLSKQLTGCSLNDIGKGMGGKDHATVIYACKQVEDRKAKDENFNRMVETLLRKIKP
ncbi:MAG: chromosomal replication initiator protein DnaA [Nitrospirae bacterium CG_4_10_14_3_um_filter_44_29]|nr:chromosomal replication initiator protein DnaA [Nitrospirota bacterium]OIO29314.1 MAG: chromosomal replication initiation protein DnaA [Nitrospirae bacterium CG1_02_44_142]PIP70200.1 MAG: chromosomal replication initiator protein DnaA [Nitrospirae bacterium CG22_combo_CG10-13_8_21_14_all_44_11]PIV40686.1 MAG: chromosomal replication initiator protein DnaA [Nitrospirae bacterium CG02_land_8_20_14_3_00_44_33]PIV65808.1 MAG: chromosomal replication initiator protein DnaA [Nitrospirae bacterium 